MGVNLGVLPTKGLTLPLMSYGGSAIVVNCVALAIVIRVDIENRQLDARRARMSASSAPMKHADGHGRGHRRTRHPGARGRGRDAAARLDA